MGEDEIVTNKNLEEIKDIVEKQISRRNKKNNLRKINKLALKAKQEIKNPNSLAIISEIIEATKPNSNHGKALRLLSQGIYQAIKLNKTVDSPTY